MIFEDPLVLERQDEVHPDRLLAIGQSDRGRLLFVVGIVTLLGRIISARRVTMHERRTDEEES